MSNTPSYTPTPTPQEAQKPSLEISEETRVKMIYLYSEFFPVLAANSLDSFLSSRLFQRLREGLEKQQNGNLSDEDFCQLILGSGTFRAPHLEGHPADPDIANIIQTTKKKMKQIESVGDAFEKEEALIAWGQKVAPEYSSSKLNKMLLELKEDLERARGSAIPFSEIYDIVLSYTSAHDSNPLGHTSEGYSDSLEDHAEEMSLKDRIFRSVVFDDPKSYPHTGFQKDCEVDETKEEKLGR